MEMDNDRTALSGLDADILLYMGRYKNWHATVIPCITFHLCYQHHSPVNMSERYIMDVPFPAETYRGVRPLFLSNVQIKTLIF